MADQFDSMEDHDSSARGEVEMGGGGQPKPTATVSGEMDDLGNPGAATSSSTPVKKDDPKRAAPEKSVSRRMFKEEEKPKPADFEREPIKTPSSTTEIIDSDDFDVPPLLDRVREQTAVRWVNWCIYEIPNNFQQRARDAYAPQVVKLGPLVYGDRQEGQCTYESRTMETIEEQKWCYLQEALSRTGDVRRGFQILHQCIRELEQNARDCYSANLSHIDSNEFVTMMVLDGCFILQILLKETERRRISPGDPIFEQRWLFLKVKRDLMLLRCQIPFLVLDCLFEQLKSSMSINGSLLEVVYEFFKDIINGPLHDTGPEPKHLLDFLHLNLFPDLPGSKRKDFFANLQPFPGATYLLEAGVEFESSRTNRLDITFEGGVLKIPHFVIEDDTKSLLLNLTAFEQLHPNRLPHVTAYTFFMHCLNNTAGDVSILCRKEVIKNLLGSNQEVANLFADLGRDITIYPNEVYVANVIKGIHNHCNKRINAWRGSFIHNYVRKPWAMVSVTAAIILLILTCIQAFFAMFSYFRPPSTS